MSRTIKNPTTGRSVAYLENDVIFNAITGNPIGVIDQAQVRSSVTGGDVFALDGQSAGCDHIVGSPGDGMCRVRFFDYEGTLLKTHYVPVGGAAVAPAIPEHSRLVFQEWNNDFDNIQRDKDVGAIYTTRSGATEIDFVLGIASGKTITVGGCYISAEMTIEWGDGTRDVFSTNGLIAPSHEYPDYGEYTIKFKCSNWYANNGVVNLVKTNTTYDYDRDTARRVYIAEGHTRNIKFNGNCQSLKEYTCCRGSVYATEFNNSHALKAYICNRGQTEAYGAWAGQLRVAVLSDTITKISGSAFRAGQACVEYIPDSVTELGSDCFRDAPNGFYSGKMDIPAGVTVIPERCFNNNRTLFEITLASPNLTEIKTNAFQYAYALKTVKLFATTPPVLDSTAFSGTNLSEILVPAGCGEAYKSATNWSVFADIIKEMEN